MTSQNSAYFRQRAQYHLTKAAQAEHGVAGIHRRFAQLYAAKAAKAEAQARARRAENRRGPGSPRLAAAMPFVSH